MLVKFQPPLKSGGCKPQKMSNACFFDFQAALVIDRCRRSVDETITVIFREIQPDLDNYVNRVLRGTIKLDGEQLFQEILGNSQRGELFVQLRHDIQQLISRHFHMRSFELAKVIAHLDNRLELQKLCRPVIANHLNEYYYSFVTVAAVTKLTNKIFEQWLEGFGLPWGLTQAAVTVEWGSVWMATAGLKPAMEKIRCAVLLNQALQGLVFNWQLTIKQELLDAVTVLLYDLHDKAQINGVYIKKQNQAMAHYRISQRLLQAI